MSTLERRADPPPATPDGAAGADAAAAAPRERWRPIVATVILVAVAAACVLLLPPMAGGALMLLVAIGYLARRLVFSWTGGLVLFVAIVMFIPVRRYALPIPLPFALEPYRVMLLVLLAALVGALLLDKRHRWQPVAFGWPIGIFIASLVVSIPLNAADLVEAGLASTAVGALVNYLILLSSFYVVRQVLTSRRIVEGLVAGLVWSGVVVAMFATFERVTQVNVFWRLATFLPLDVIADEGAAFRAGGYRSYGSSQHPIALSVMLCMLIPLAIYLAKYAKWPGNEWNRRIVYGIATGALLLGVLSAVSRTAVVVLAVMLLLTLLLRPYLGITLVLLSLPALVLGFLVLPNMFDTLIGSFLDLDALIASQHTSPGWGGAGRLADLDPAFALIAQDPFFGTGVGSRIVVGDDSNAFILDNQVLGTLMEAGAIGVAGLAALMLMPPIMLLRFAFVTARHDTRFAMLAFAIVASCTGYITALFFYDAFGFYQTFFVLCMELAIGAWLLTASPPAKAAAAAKAAAREAAAARTPTPAEARS